MSNTHSTSQSQPSRNDRKQTHDEQAHGETDHRRPTPMQVLRSAREQLSELTGLVPEAVTSFEQTADGWSLEVEVVEIDRVPDTMSVMASYQVDVNPDGELEGYRRVRRYERGRVDSRRSGGG
ncbi:gas vesicle protein [Streptomyces rubradiris]|nr:gas vesicle protein [Streptomyces rubradiris]